MHLPNWGWRATPRTTRSRRPGGVWRHCGTRTATPMRRPSPRHSAQRGVRRHPPRAPARRGRTGHGPATACAATRRRERSALALIRRKFKLTLEQAAAGCIPLVRGAARRCAPPAPAWAMRCWPAPAHRGSSAVRQSSVWFGWSGNEAPCEDCVGTGVGRRSCAPCQGSGKAAASAYQVRVRIPPGVRDGDLLHAHGEYAGKRRRPGIADHGHALFPRCRRRRTAGAGGRFSWIAQRSVTVPTLYVRAALAQPAAPSPARPRAPAARRSDLHVAIAPVFPEQLSTDQNILLDQLIATTSGSGAPRLALRDWPGRCGSGRRAGAAKVSAAGASAPGSLAGLGMATHKCRRTLHSLSSASTTHAQFVLISLPINHTCHDQAPAVRIGLAAPGTRQVLRSWPPCCHGCR